MFFLVLLMNSRMAASVHLGLDASL